MNYDKIYRYYTLNRQELAPGEALNLLNNKEQFIVSFDGKSYELDESFFNINYGDLSKTNRDIIDRLPNRHKN